MKTVLQILMVAGGIGIASQARGELIASERFESSGTELDAESGFGWDGGWIGGLDGILCEYDISSGLEYSNTTVTIPSKGGCASGIGKIFRYLAKPIEVNDGVTIWVSCLMNSYFYVNPRRSQPNYKYIYHNVTLFGSGRDGSVVYDEILGFGVTNATPPFLRVDSKNLVYSFFSPGGGVAEKSGVIVNYNMDVTDLVHRPLDSRRIMRFPFLGRFS